jgi:phosphoserine aminotransferase
MKERIENHNPGPSMLPWEILRDASKDIIDYHEGMGVLEINHRSKEFDAMLEHVETGLRRFMEIPDTHDVLFMPDGWSLQFYASVVNIEENGVTMYWEVFLVMRSLKRSVGWDRCESSGRQDRGYYEQAHE